MTVSFSDDEWPLVFAVLTAAGGVLDARKHARAVHGTAGQVPADLELDEQISGLESAFNRLTTFYGIAPPHELSFEGRLK